MGVSEWFQGFADPEGWVVLERMVAAGDESGGYFYRTGETFEAYEVKLNAREAFYLGQDAGSATFRFWADAPLNVTERERLYHPFYGQLDVISSVRDRLGQGMVIIDAEDVSPAEGE